MVVGEEIVAEGDVAELEECAYADEPACCGLTWRGADWFSRRFH